MDIKKADVVCKRIVNRIKCCVEVDPLAETSHRVGPKAYHHVVDWCSWFRKVHLDAGKCCRANDSQ